MGISKPTRFTVRVYGMLLTAERELLITHEQIKDMAVTKLPGGAVEFGEGLHEALAREFQEELGLPININRQLWTNEAYIQSAFDPDFQVFGIYYEVSATRELITKLKKKEQAEGGFAFEFRDLLNLSEEDFTFEMDRNALRSFFRTLGS